MKPPAKCPFCDAPLLTISKPRRIWAEYRCGTSKGAKGSKWLWFQTFQCKENAKKN